VKIFYFPSFYPSDRPNEKWTGAFTHRQVKALMQLAEVEVIIPIPSHPVWPFYYLSSEWRVNRNRIYPMRREYEGVRIVHPRVSVPKPGRFFKSYSEHYKSAVLHYFEGKELDSTKVFFFAQWIPEASFVVELGKKLNIKTCILGIGDDVLKFPLRTAKTLAAFKSCWRDADVRSVVADYVGKEANKIYGEDLPYEVFYSSVDPDEFYPLPIEQKQQLRVTMGFPVDSVLILCVGSPIIRKGWLDLFAALSSLSKLDFLLLGINGGKPELDLDQEAAKRALSGKFINVGEVIPGDIKKYYQVADLFCLPSHWEGLANALLEAMASGLPVITTNVSGHPEVLNHGVNGYMIDVGDINNLTRYLDDLIKNEESRKTLGLNARESIKYRPGSHHQTAKKIISVLKSLPS
jgi:glycosyltransferase involved in cell wall biosynthesis